MKKLIYTLLLTLPFVGMSQNISGIRTQQSGEKIIIFYKIDDSDPSQLFRVKVYCSIDDGDKIRLNAVTGDVGDNIQGGKTEYSIVWDVLEDVDELYSAEFFVEAEIKENGSQISVEPGITRKFKHIISFNSGLTNTPYGFKYSLIYNDIFGLYASLRLGEGGRYYDVWYYLEDNIDGSQYVDSYHYDYDESAFSIMGGAMYNLTRKSENSLYVYLGAGYGQWGGYKTSWNREFKYTDINGNYHEETYTNITDSHTDWGFEFEYGVLMNINHFCLGAGLTHVFGIYFQTNATVNIGLAF